MSGMEKCHVYPRIMPWGQGSITAPILTHAKGGRSGHLNAPVTLHS